MIYGVDFLHCGRPQKKKSTLHLSRCAPWRGADSKAGGTNTTTPSSTLKEDPFYCNPCGGCADIFVATRKCQPTNQTNKQEKHKHLHTHTHIQRE
ncbi:hypothetical protein TRSC58_07676 [Trypanosoma rangeli SC58]|uniref:Uncharacterized protein n=1 Tax=Trypanosoma rangeli SC58 TaxID=429131 RepID=A0A061ISE8_TRYRA|nr:hypothetical protein TRSC58_07676 [Trypanosoma rangeli SC58]